MIVMKPSLCRISLAIGICLVPFLSQARWKLVSSLDYEKSDGNYNSSGEPQRLPNGGSFTSSVFDNQLVYDPGEDMAYFTNVGVAYSESIGLGDARTNSNLTYVKLGSDFYLDRSSTESGFRGTFKIPTQRVSSQTDAVLLDEGDMSVRGDFFYRAPFSSFVWNSLVGIEYRDEGRAGLFHYQLGLCNNSKVFQLGADLIGFLTASEDQYTSTPSKRQEITRRVDGGSQKYYAVNPDQLRAKFWTKYWLDMNLKAGAAIVTDVMGKNSSAGLGFLATLEFEFGRIGRPYKRHRTGDEDANFTVDTDDGVDQRIFDSDSREEARRRRLQNQQQQQRQH